MTIYIQLTDSDSRINLNIHIYYINEHVIANASVNTMHERKCFPQNEKKSMNVS